MRFAPHTDDDVREMLGAIGLDSLDELFDQIPPASGSTGPLDLPEGISEMELLADLRGLAARNRHADDLVCFAGAGAYDHYVPAVVWALAGRSEFYTSYTPYQPELSQGVLQALFEYQSMICELTELEVSNASLYDGATALAEAVNLARSSPARGRVLVSAGVDRRYVETLRTYGRGAGYEPEIFDVVDGRGGTPDVTDDVACVIVQHPNAYGLLEPARDLFGAAHAGGARAIEIFDPLSLGVLAPAGRAPCGHRRGRGATARKPPELRRAVPRDHRDTAGRRPPSPGTDRRRDRRRRRKDGLRPHACRRASSTSAARRRRATSARTRRLMAIAATVYLAWLGPQGLAELGERCAAKARYAADRLCDVSGVDLLFGDAPFFKEFALRLPRPAAEVVDALVDRGFLGGVALPDADGHALLVAVTERRTREEIDAFALALKEVLS